MSIPPPSGNDPFQQPFPGAPQAPGFPPASGYQPPPTYQTPIGYQPYGGTPPVTPQGTNGLSIASFVLSVVNIIPCFWIFPLPALLGVIFGFVGRSQIKRNAGARGRGLAIAGIVIGLIFFAVAVIFWAYVANSDNCTRDGSSFHCESR